MNRRVDRGPVGGSVVLQLVLMIVATGGVLFLAAGDVGWPAGWLYVALWGAATAAATFAMTRRHPELAEERMHGRAGMPRWDKAFMPIIAIVGPFTVLAVAGLDYRLAPEPVFPLWTLAAGLALFLGGYALALWAVLANRFFSAVVRIQADRGHEVVSDGPYRYVRHPGYTGTLGITLAPPLILGSAWALIPTGLLVALHVVRTALEDRFLRAELAGYADYAVPHQGKSAILESIENAPARLKAAATGPATNPTRLQIPGRNSRIREIPHCPLRLNGLEHRLRRPI